MAKTSHLLARYFTAQSHTVSISSLFILHDQRNISLTSGHNRTGGYKAVNETQAHHPLC
jgi:hypothetical protein